MRLRSAVTYANVLSTVAVFIALGGASYAAISLPTNSVGTAQIRNGAVTLPKLGVALASSAAQIPAPQVVPGFSCGSSGGFGSDAPSCPGPRTVRLVSTSITLKRRANLLVFGTGVAGSAEASGTVQVQLHVVLDQGRSGPGAPYSVTTITPNSTASASLIATLTNIPAGRHTVELMAVGGPTRVGVSDAQVTAIALPSG
jgi:hypothetical protein